MQIKVLGSGCSKCQIMHTAICEVLAEYKSSAQVEKIEDLDEIMAYGVMTTPAVIIGSKVVLTGTAPKSTLVKVLTDYQIISSGETQDFSCV